MESQDLDAFVKFLTDKGYDGFFHTESFYAGNLKDSISNFLEAWKNGEDAPLLANHLHLSTYLQWNGDQKPNVACYIWVKYENEKFNLEGTEMLIKKSDRYGQLLKESKLSNLTANLFPSAKEAIAQVSEKPREQLAPKKRGFRM